MSDVVQQHGHLRSFILLVGYVDAFDAEVIKHAAHQVHGAERVLEPCVLGPRINEIGKTKLFDTAEALEIGV